MGRYLTLDADIATASARFLIDPDGVGRYVPESLNVVTSAGVTYDNPGFAASLRYRYFGPRVLDQTGAAVSAPTNLVNAQFTLKGKRGQGLSLNGFNLLNSAGDDVEYYYGSWVPKDAASPVYANNPAVNPALGGAGANDFHFRPTESRVFRLTLSVPFINICAR